MPAFTFKVTGKTILFGEHVVVYGYPAIAVPLHSIHLKISIFPILKEVSRKVIITDLNKDSSIQIDEMDRENPVRMAIRVMKKELSVNQLPPMEIRISSSIPTSAGLGSSAAFAVALSKSLSGFLGFHLDTNKINQIAFEIEKIQHGTPSGIDNTVIAYNKPVFFRKGHPVEFITLGKSLTLIVADTGLRTPTIETVKMVREKYKNNKQVFGHIFEQIGEITVKAIDLLEQGDEVNLGKLITQNHCLLKKLSVSNQALDQLVETALDHGAYGAKLCGGGRGGNIIALVDSSKAKKTNQTLLDSGAASSFISKISPEKTGKQQ